MSTFKGIVQGQHIFSTSTITPWSLTRVKEFPHIRIDYFRQQPGHKAPLACFLSHVHSDHLTGLESLRAPFVYCSAATREILLRLEKYHYRVNFSRGILESRNVTYDRSMRKLAKPLPLDTPTTIELAPGNKIRVTLVDANHCVGAVMFLIEGDGKAILYTGDIRAETWWVNSLVQNPILLPYTLGPKVLDCIYLDTTELLQKVSSYPDDTVFYFHSWTFGYENVWIALSNFLQSRVHLDDYRACIYGSLSTLDKKSLHNGGLTVPRENAYLQSSGLEIREAAALCGFKNGNHIQPGCLTTDPNARIHSCERGMGCPLMDDGPNHANSQVVHIIPIVNRIDNTEILEVGAGGGNGDLNQKEELETGDALDIGKLAELCTKLIKDPGTLSKVLALVQQAPDDGNITIDLSMELQRESPDSEPEMTFPKLVAALTSHVSKPNDSTTQPHNSIHFPYSRHSSYSELCALVEAFKPKDIFPCTVDETKWDPTVSMRNLFGSYCSGETFRHDAEMMSVYEARIEKQANFRRTRETQSSTQDSEAQRATPPKQKKQRTDAMETVESAEPEPDSDTFHTPIQLPLASTAMVGEAKVSDAAQSPISPSPNPDGSNGMPTSATAMPISSFPAAAPLKEPIDPKPSTSKISEQDQHNRTREFNRYLAYEAALGLRLTWTDYGGLVSTRRKEDQAEYELEL
ncbi:hypothetical protein DM02DRAFT_675983 [Periconia macrospinosa]|uniref:Protein artemis n=1 Tax=Periconia macrospinosa TaxID=97972 RepID=A0A2V1DB38_9PLEO|nr:hypothetical protein DM02DRAFT_675983 [Periconia macrospinosa]